MGNKWVCEFLSLWIICPSSPSVPPSVLGLLCSTSGASQTGQAAVWVNKTSEGSLVCGTLLSPFPLLGRQKQCEWREPESAASRGVVAVRPPHLWVSKIKHTHTRREGRWSKVGCEFPRMLACRQGQVEGGPSTAESWGFLGVVGMCALGCDAWAVCRSGWGRDCCEEGHTGSGRSRWPFHWVLVRHSQWALCCRKERSGRGTLEEVWGWRVAGTG